jgi:hypothetical protein
VSGWKNSRTGGGVIRPWGNRGDGIVISRELGRNVTKTRGCRVGWAQDLARERRSRPMERKVQADSVLRAQVMSDLAVGRSPRPLAPAARRSVAQGGRRDHPCSRDRSSNAYSAAPPLDTAALKR